MIHQLSVTKTNIVKSQYEAFPPLKTGVIETDLYD